MPTSNRNPQQLDLFSTTPSDDIELADLFQAYYDCRHNKRGTANALKFELDYEANLTRLWRDINDGSYRPGKSITFIVNKPVKREIFAADFRDRVVHHLIINKLNPLFERQFIYDSYACRRDKGALLGIRRLERFIRRCSANYTRDCYILKLDVQGFFMHIDREKLLARLTGFIDDNYRQNDQAKLQELVRLTLANNPAGNCFIKGRRSDWDGLPKDKSLFHSPPGSGLPIGNLTSQVFANFYMNTFDHFMKHDLGIKYYGRYVDDFVVVHEDLDYLRSLISIIRQFLAAELSLTLHPRKIYLQHYSKGVAWLGVFIKPGRTYAGRRLKGNFYDVINLWNSVVRESPLSRERQMAYVSTMNSYLGLLQHHDTYQLRSALIRGRISGYWDNYVYSSGGLSKLVLKTRRIKKPCQCR